MKKWIITLFVTITLLMLMPLGMGILTKINILHQCNEMNKIMGQYLQFEIDDYSLGWFNSSAKLRLHLKSDTISLALSKQFYPYIITEYQERSMERFPLTLNLQIKHGPIIIQQNTTNLSEAQFGLGFFLATLDIPWNEQGQWYANEIIGKQKLLTCTALFHYFGTLTTQIALPKIFYLDRIFGKVYNWSGAVLNTTLSEDTNIIAFNLDITPIHISNRMVSSRIFDSSDIILSGEFKHDSYGESFCNLNVKIDNIIISKDGSPHHGLFGFKADVKMNRDSVDKKCFSATIDLNSFNLEERNYGPANLSLSVNGIVGKEFDRFVDKIYHINLQNIPKDPTTLYSAKLQPLFLKMLDKTNFNLAFKARVPEGDIKLTLRIDIINDQNGIPDITVLADKAIATATFSLPKSALKSIHSYIFEPDLTYINHRLEIGNDYYSSKNVNSNDTNLNEEFTNDSIDKLLNDGWISATDNNYIGFYTYINGKLMSNGKLMLDILNKPKQSEETSNRTPN